MEKEERERLEQELKDIDNKIEFVTLMLRLLKDEPPDTTVNEKEERMIYKAYLYGRRDEAARRFIMHGQMN